MTAIERPPSLRAEELGLPELPDAGDDGRRDRPSPLAILHELSVVLGSRSLDRGALLETLLDGAVSLTGAERGLIVLYAADGRELRIELARGQGGQTLDPARFDISRTILDRVLESGRPAHIPRTADDESLSSAESVHRLRIVSIMCAPLRLRLRGPRPPGGERRRLGSGAARVLGAIYLDSAAHDHVFSAEDLGAFCTLTNHATSILTNHRFFQEATSDRLTGLLNRRQFRALIDDERQLARSSGAPFACALLDLDGFRRVNTTRGRRAGDALLVTVARALVAGARQIDCVGRLGADLFCVLMPDTDREGGAAAIRRLREALREAGVELPFTAGLAIGDDDAIEPDALLARADRALYAAKASGAPLRCWEPGMASGGGRADKLAGILTGDDATDYRNVQALLEAISASASVVDPSELSLRALGQAIGFLDADGGALLLEPAEDLPDTLPLRRGRSQSGAATAVSALQEGLAREALTTRRLLRLGGEGEPARMAAPLAPPGREIGALIVERAGEPFSDNEATFFSALTRELAAGLGAALLRHQLERQRERAVEAVARSSSELEEAQRALAEQQGRGRLIGRSPAMQPLLASLDRVAGSDLPVLLTGESGTGKERLARTLHALGPRASGPFRSENCAAISPSLLESELFGHVKGAFTGAIADKAGLFEQAHGGTLLLDEIGDLGLELQAKLLRVLEEGEVRPVGGERTREVDVRVLAATHHDLKQLVAEGRFREDLYYRLAVVTQRLPPLRERLADLPLLLEAFAAEDDLPPLELTADAIRRLAEHRWPGNIRELRNTIDKLRLFATPGEPIDAEAVAAQLDPAPPAGDDIAALFGGALKTARAAFERRFLVDALARCGGNISRMAQTIQLDRRYLYDLLDKHELRPKKK